MRNFEKYWDKIKETCLSDRDPQYCVISTKILGRTCNVTCDECNRKIAAWLTAQADNDPAPIEVQDTVFSVLIDEICDLLEEYPSHGEVNDELFRIIREDPRVRDGVDFDLDLSEILKSTVAHETDGYHIMRGL